MDDLRCEECRRLQFALPSRLNKGLNVFPVRWRCFDANDRFICISVQLEPLPLRDDLVISADASCVLGYSRFADKTVRNIWNQVEVTVLRLHYDGVQRNDLLATGLLDGSVSVCRLASSGVILKNSLIWNASKVHRAPVTALQWSPTGKQLFSGDSSGCVLVTDVDLSQNNFQTSFLCSEDSRISQMSCVSSLLAIATCKRTVLITLNNASDANVIQIGESPRKSSSLSGVRLVETESESGGICIDVYSTRPGCRLWRAQTNGSVVQTFQLREAIRDFPLSFWPHGTGTRGTAGFQSREQPRSFGKIDICFKPSISYVRNSRDLYLVTYADSDLTIIDLACNTVVLRRRFNGLIHDVSVAQPKGEWEIFVMVYPNRLIRLAFWPCPLLTSWSARANSSPHNRLNSKLNSIQSKARSAISAFAIINDEEHVWPKNEEQQNNVMTTSRDVEIDVKGHGPNNSVMVVPDSGAGTDSGRASGSPQLSSGRNKRTYGPRSDDFSVATSSSHGDSVPMKVSGEASDATISSFIDVRVYRKVPKKKRPFSLQHGSKLTQIGDSGAKIAANPFGSPPERDFSDEIDNRVICSSNPANLAEFPETRRSNSPDSSLPELYETRSMGYRRTTDTMGHFSDSASVSVVSSSSFRHSTDSDTGHHYAQRRGSTTTHGHIMNMTRDDMNDEPNVYAMVQTAESAVLSQMEKVDSFLHATSESKEFLESFLDEAFLQDFLPKEEETGEIIDFSAENNNDTDTVSSDEIECRNISLEVRSVIDEILFAIESGQLAGILNHSVNSGKEYDSLDMPVGCSMEQTVDAEKSSDLVDTDFPPESDGFFQDRLDFEVSGNTVVAIDIEANPPKENNKISGSKTTHSQFESSENDFQSALSRALQKVKETTVSIPEQSLERRSQLPFPGQPIDHPYNRPRPIVALGTEIECSSTTTTTTQRRDVAGQSSSGSPLDGQSSSVTKSSRDRFGVANSPEEILASPHDVIDGHCPVSSRFNNFRTTGKLQSSHTARVGLSCDIWSSFSGGFPIGSLSGSKHYVAYTDSRSNLYYSSTNEANLSFKQTSVRADSVFVSANGKNVWILAHDVMYTLKRPHMKKLKGHSWLAFAERVSGAALTNESAWILKLDGELVFYPHLTPELLLSPSGSCSARVDVPCAFVQVAVCPTLPDRLWAVSDDGVLYVRTGISYARPLGLEWEELSCFPSSVRFVQVQLSASHCWAVDTNDQLWFTVDFDRSTVKWYQVATPLTKDQFEMEAKDSLGVMTYHDAAPLVWTSPSGAVWFSAGSNLFYTRTPLSDYVWLVRNNRDIVTYQPKTNRLKRISLEYTGNPIVCLAASPESVWVVDSKGSIFVRYGFSSEEPAGTDWFRLSLLQFGTTAHFVHLSTSVSTTWAVDSRGGLWACLSAFGAVQPDSLPPAWIQISAPPCRAVWQSPDGTQIWALTTRGHILVRQGIDVEIPIGLDWQPIADFEATSCAVAGTAAWVLSTSGRVHSRGGIANSCPEGSHWRLVPGRLTALSATAGQRLLGLDRAGRLLKHSARVYYCMQGNGSGGCGGSYLQGESGWELV